MEFGYKNMSIDVSIEEYIDACVDMPRIIKGCQGCTNYGKLWSCPPFAFDPVNIWHSYSKLKLYAKKVMLPDELTKRTYSQSELSNEYFKIWKVERTSFFNELLSLERTERDSRALVAGCCDICNECARLSGKKCIMPEKLRYSIEALGGDVERTLNLYFDEKTLWAKDGHMSEYILLVGALMLK